MSRAGTGWLGRRLGERAVAQRGGRSWRARPRGSSPPPRSTGTPQRAAAAASSIVRAAAPQRRIGSKKCRVLREPSVSWLPKRFSSPGRLHDAHALPVGLELVGHDHRHAGAHALPHLGAVADDADGAVGPMATKTSGSSTQPLGMPSAPYFGGSAARTADGNPAASTSPPERGHALEEPPAAHVGEHHGRPIA